MAVRIQCINKTHRSNIHERISHVGGLNNDGTRWKETVTSVISYIKNGTYSFYVQVGNNTAEVIVATSAAGYEYLKTKADTTTVDNLLSLPECP